MIATWATRRTVESLDAIEDVDVISPKKERRKPAFEIDDGKITRVFWLIVVDLEKIPPVAQLAVHKKKVAQVSNWLKEFPHHRKVDSFLWIVLKGRNYLFFRDLREPESQRQCKVWQKVSTSKLSNG